jgi:hypothetical protein
MRQPNDGSPTPKAHKASQMGSPSHNNNTSSNPTPPLEARLSTLKTVSSLRKMWLKKTKQKPQD